MKVKKKKESEGMVIIRGKEGKLKAKIKVILCHSYLEKARGLMFRSHGNALLIFKKEKNQGIWMFGMKYSLYLYFIDSQGRIIKKEYASPLSFNPKTWKIYSAKANYVLEVDAREEVNKHIDVGDLCIFPSSLLGNHGKEP